LKFLIKIFIYYIHVYCQIHSTIKFVFLNGGNLSIIGRSIDYVQGRLYGTQEMIVFVVLSLMTLVIENCIKNHKGKFLKSTRQFRI